MIQLLFDYGTEKVLIIIRGSDVRFGNTAFGAQTTNIDGLKLNYAGVIREFPDLKLRADWRHEAVKRFKEKIKTFDTEEQVAEYIIEDLKKFGYKLYGTQKGGHRLQKIKNER